MRQVSQSFKDAIRQYGRQIDVMITYNENGTSKMLDVNDLFSVTPIVQGNLLKSVMKQLNFESTKKVPQGTWVNVKFGVLVVKGLSVQEVHQMRVDRLNSTEVRMLAGFEYINLGGYLVSEEPEYNADTTSYTHKCFDKMIYAMKPYQTLNNPYPISIKNYLTLLANTLGIRFKETSFYNQNQMIQSELYGGLEYTYRDVLDEIAQATGSIICINDNNELEVRYLQDTNEIINEEMLKDINVSFKDRYGLINSVVLSRSAGSDNVYLRDEQSVTENGLCEVKISDNQILNDNNRSNYLQGLLDALDGINYYINDFKSTGICYLELGDKYNIQIGNTTYNCVLLNDEIDITQGLEEQIYTEMPEQSETDYTKADKTDQKINQTNLIVDKQQQQINATITRVTENEEKISSLQIDVDGISTEVSKKVGENEIISKINQSAEAVTIDANKISLNGKTINLTSDNMTISSTYFNVNKYGTMTCKDAIMDSLSINNNKFSIDNDGNMSCSNATITGGTMKINSNTSVDIIKITDRNNSNRYVSIGCNESKFNNIDGSSYISIHNNYSGTPTIEFEGQSGNVEITDGSIAVRDSNDSSTIFPDVIYTPSLVQTSKEEKKKNFEKCTNALNTLKNIDIYKYNLKNEEDGTKKHIGFVIGKDFKYSEEVTSKNNDGADIYSFVSLCCQAIKEQQEEIEKLKKIIEGGQE